MEFKKCPICESNGPNFLIDNYGLLHLKCCNIETKGHKNISDAINEWNDLIEKIEVAEIEWDVVEDITDLPIDDKSTYYDAGGISTMNVIKAKLTEDQFKGFLLGNIIKYSCRLNHKDNPKRDAEKVANYSKILSEI